MVSVIIPAHNEEIVIGRCLNALTTGAFDDELEVIVVCNGCCDDTAKIAREFGGPVKVIETPVASKSHALNLGDNAATAFPRFYIDADVSVTLGAIRDVAKVLEGGEVLAAAPKMSVDLTDRSWSVRAFYQVWLQTAYHREGMIGSGVYALSRSGRSRFIHFPPIIADDGYVYNLFTPAERQTVITEPFIVYPPRTLSGIVKIMTRSRLGDCELREKGFLAAHPSSSSWALLRRLLVRPHYWPASMIYLAVKIVTRFRARSQMARLLAYRWERDESSRQADSCFRTN